MLPICANATQKYQKLSLYFITAVPFECVQSLDRLYPCSQISHVQENPVQRLAAAAVVKCPVRQFIPTLFMLSDSGPVLATKCATDVPFPKLSSERQECCCKAMGNRVPPGINLFNCILLATDPTAAEPLVYCTCSVITINDWWGDIAKISLGHCVSLSLF